MGQDNNEKKNYLITVVFEFNMLVKLAISGEDQRVQPQEAYGTVLMNGRPIPALHRQPSCWDLFSYLNWHYRPVVAGDVGGDQY